MESSFCVRILDEDDGCKLAECLRRLAERIGDKGKLPVGYRYDGVNTIAVMETSDVDGRIVGHHERFVVLYHKNHVDGNFGRGGTVHQALRRLRAAIDGDNEVRLEDCTLYRFRSHLPFCDNSEEPATKGEADCWVGSDGSVSWVRCSREVLFRPDGSF